jgi:hypothetical protein
VERLAGSQKAGHVVFAHGHPLDLPCGDPGRHLARDLPDLALEVADARLARVETILLWSALPGASRHHWGSDIDVADGHAIAAGYRPRLEPDEYRRGGPFAGLARWLGAHMRRYGFYRPYTRRGSGVQPEPWHLSYAPVSQRALPRMTLGLLTAALAGNGVEGEAAILERLASIRERYVLDVDAPPRMRSRYARLSRR